MGKVEKVSIALTEELAGAVREAVDAGRYASASEVVREALRDWTEKQRLREAKLAELRRLVDEGLDSGVAAPRSMDDIIASARDRAADRASRESPGQDRGSHRSHG
jgi:antitoxin ParD1/3/4